MAKITDLTGRRFGRLVVLRRGEDYIVPPDYSRNGRTNRLVRWICQCDCGNIKLAYASSLMCGKTQSCGCLKLEQSSERMRAFNQGRSERNELSASKIENSTNNENNTKNNKGGGKAPDERPDK